MTYNLGLLMRTLFGIGTPKQAMAGGPGWPLGPMIGTYRLSGGLSAILKPSSDYLAAISFSSLKTTRVRQ